MFLANKLNKGGSLSSPDAQFNYVTMLLHGDGTNGAQNNTFLDSSTNNFTITRNGNTTQGSFSPYGSNWSNYFDGSTDWFSVADNSALDFDAGDLTAEAWIYLSDATAVNTVVAKGFASAGGWMLWVQSTLRIRMYDASGSSITATSSASLTSNSWNHVAATRSGNTLTVYINGVSSGTATFSGTSTNSAALEIGAYNSGNGNLAGYISNLRLVKGTAVYTGNFTPSTTPLTAVSGTSLLTCQSNRFIDNSANNFTLTKTGDISVQRFNPFGASTAYSTSVIGGSGYFDGSDYLAISNGGGSALDMGTGDCTIEMWVYPDTQSTSFPSMFAPKNGWSSGTFYIRYQSSKFGIYWNGVGDPFFVSTNTYPINSWYHVALVRSGTTFTLYVNGVSAGTGTSSATLNLAIGGEVWLGNNTSASCYYKGLLSDVRVVKGTAVYTTTFTPPTAPLTAISGTSLLTNFTNGAIYDNAMMNDLETVGNAQISTSVKKYGTGSLVFDGTGDWLIMPYGPTQNFGTGSFTIEGWFYLNSLAASYYVPCGTWGSGTSDEWLIQIQNNGSIRFLTTSGSTFYSASITTATWYHIAVVRNGSTVTIYVNGTSVGSYTCTNSLGSTAKTLYIGTQAGTWDWNGYIDDFRITNGYARYTANFTSPTAAFSNTGPI